MSPDMTREALRCEHVNHGAAGAGNGGGPSASAKTREGRQSITHD